MDGVIGGNVKVGVARVTGVFASVGGWACVVAGGRPAWVIAGWDLHYLE